MIAKPPLPKRIEKIDAALKTQLGLRGRGFVQRLQLGGRSFPRALRSDVTQLVDVSRKLAHPKLARLIDVDASHRAADRLEAYLAGIDPRERRMTALIRFASTLVFNLILAVLIFAGILWALAQVPL